jgi:hypothetical protein
MDAVLRRHKEMIPECTTKNRMMVGIRGMFGCFYKNVFAAAARSWLMMMMLHKNKVLNR